MLPPTHYRSEQEIPQAKAFKEALKRRAYAHQNPNSPEGKAYFARVRLSPAPDFRAATQSLLDEIAAAMILTAEDLATRVGPEPFE